MKPLGGVREPPAGRGTSLWLPAEGVVTATPTQLLLLSSCPCEAAINNYADEPETVGARARVTPFLFFFLFFSF